MKILIECLMVLIIIILSVWVIYYSVQNPRVTKKIDSPSLIGAGVTEEKSAPFVIPEIAPSVLPTKYEDSEVIDIRGNKQSTPDLLKFDAKEMAGNGSDDNKDMKEMLDSPSAPECIDVGYLPFYPIDAPSGGFCANNDHCCELSCPIESVPEPSSYSLAMIGLGVLLLIKRKFFCYDSI